MNSEYLLFWYCFLTLSILSGCLSQNNPAYKTDPPETQKVLQTLDNKFKDCFAWWAEVYDPQSGGCYYSISSRDCIGYAPYIEAGSKILNVLEWTGALEQAPQKFKDGIIRYMQARQDPDTGFFKDPEYTDDLGHMTINRALSMASGSIEKCGGKPLYPLPLDRAELSDEAQKQYAHLTSPEALTAWLDALPWETRVWTCGAQLRAQNGVFKEMQEPRRTQLLDTISEYLNDKQTENGFFGSRDDHWYSALSGTYKAAAFLQINGRPIPNPEIMTATVLEHLNTQEYENLIVLYNTINILNMLNLELPEGLCLEQRLDIVRKATTILSTLRGPDGGYLTHKNKPAPKANNYHLADNVIESDTNSTGLAHKTRSLLIELLTGNPGPHPHPRVNDLLTALDQADTDQHSGYIPNTWKARGGMWTEDEAGIITGSSQKDCYLWHRTDHPDDFTLTATMTAVEGSELSLWVCGSPKKTELDGYTFAVSTKGAKLQRKGRTLMKHEGATIKAGQSYPLKIERVGNTINAYFINIAKPIFSFEDPNPLAGNGHRTWGFYIWKGTTRIHSFTMQDNKE